jgi:hypothetical protein
MHRKLTTLTQLLFPRTIKMFLQRAFGINPNGTPITNPALLPEKLKKYNSVKSMELYNEMLTAITNRGDEAVLKEAKSDHPDAVLAAGAIRRFCKSHPKESNYVRFFEVETTQNLDVMVPPK